MIDAKTLPKGKTFKLISTDDPKGNVYEEGDPVTTRKKNPMKVGDIKQVTAYKLKDKTYFSGDVTSLKLNSSKADSRVRWLNDDLTEDHKTVIRLEKKRQKMNDTVMKVKAFRKSLLSLPVGLDVEEKEELSKEVAMLIDWAKTHISEAFDIMMGAKVEDTSPSF